jgi:hypothetical protein
MDRDKIIIWSGLATGAVLTSAALYWAGKKLLDDYVPYEVRTELSALLSHQTQPNNIVVLMLLVACCCSTITGLGQSQDGWHRPWTVIHKGGVVSAACMQGSVVLLVTHGSASLWPFNLLWLLLICCCLQAGGQSGCTWTAAST